MPKKPTFWSTGYQYSSMDSWLSISPRNQILTGTSLHSFSGLVIKFYMPLSMASWGFFSIEHLSKRPGHSEAWPSRWSVSSHSGFQTKSINGLFPGDKRTFWILSPTHVAPPSWFWGGCSWSKNGEYVCRSAIKLKVRALPFWPDPYLTHQRDIDMFPHGMVKNSSSIARESWVV